LLGWQKELLVEQLDCISLKTLGNFTSWISLSLSGIAISIYIYIYLQGSRSKLSVTSTVLSQWIISLLGLVFRSAESLRVLTGLEE